MWNTLRKEYQRNRDAHPTNQGYARRSVPYLHLAR